MQKVKAFLLGIGSVLDSITIWRLSLLFVVCLGVWGIYHPPVQPGPGPVPIPDVEPDASHPIIAPTIVNAPVEEETPITVKALGAVKFAASGNVIIRQAGMTAYVMPLVEGEHKILVTMDAGGWWWARHDSAFTWIKIRTAKPPPPVPPIPPVPPEPPTPPAPIPVAGFRVLIVYETTDKMPPAQQAIITGKTVRDYLEAKCAMGPDSRTKEYRIWDKDVVATGEAKLWQDALARPHPSIPWVIVSNGKSGFEGQLPASVNETIALFERFAK